MASLKTTTGTKFTSNQPAQNPNDLMRRGEVEALLAEKAAIDQDWSYLAIYDFESGVRAVIPDYIQDSATVIWAEVEGIRRATVRVADNGGLGISEAGVAVVFGTGANQVARGNHTHSQLHDPFTVAASNALMLNLAGQQLTAELRYVAEGLAVNESGVRLVFGTGHNEVARGDHTHANLHSPLTLAASQSLAMSLAGQELTAALRIAANGALAVGESGVRVVLGTGHYQAAHGDHTHAGLDQLHAPLTLAASQTLAMSLAGQELTANVRLAAAGGLTANDSGVRMLLKSSGGLLLSDYGAAVDFGTGANQAARGNHTHANLHSPLTLAASQSLAMSLAGQELTAALRIAPDSALAVGESGVRVVLGTGHDEAARGDHTHEGMHAAVTVANSSTLALSLNVQAITGSVRLNSSPSPGEGLLRATSAGLVVVLGESGINAARGDHTHSAATDVLGGFMSAADKAKLDALSNLEVADTATLNLVYESGVLNGVVRHGAGLGVTEDGLVWAPGLEDTSTVRLRYLANKLKAEILFGAGLMIGESGLQVNPAFLTENNLELSNEAPPTLDVGQLPTAGVSTKARRADAKPGLPGLATSGAHGFQDKEDKRRFDLTHAGGFNDVVTGIEIDCERELIYLIGDFTKYGNVGSTRIAAVKYNGTIDPLFAPGVSFSARPGHLKRHSGGDLLVGGTTAKLSYRGATAQWLHKLDRTGTPDPAFTSPSAIASTGGDTFLSLSPLSDGTMIVQSWQTVRHLAATGSTLTTKTGAQNLHHTVADGTDVYLMSRRAADFNGGLNPRAIKRLDYAAGTGAVFSQWATNGGVGGEANASYAVLSPLEDFIIVSNSLASGNGGGSSYAWNGGSASKHTGLYKIRKDGTEDPDWAIDMVVTSDWPRPLAIDSKGRVYFTGDITEINGTTVTPWRLYRVEADGSGLRVFDGFNGAVHDAKLAGDDYLVVAGAFTQYGTLPAGRMVFMDAEGRAMPFIPSCKPTKMERRSITAASAPTELEMVCGKRFLAVEFDVALPVYGSYAHPVILSRKHVVDGESMLLHFDMPASTAVTIEIYDNVASGTPILSFAGKTTAVPLYAEFRLDPETGSWRLLALGYLSDAATDSTKVAKAGDTMTGHLTLHADPSANLHAATKQYADSKLAKTGGTLSGLLDFSGTTHGGMRLNNLTSGQRDSLTVKPVGCPIWNTTTGRMEVWNGSLWQTYALTSTAYALYVENGSGGELYATGANSAGIGSYGQATGAGAFVLGSNLSSAPNIASGVRSFAGGGNGLVASGTSAICLGGFGNNSIGNASVMLGGNGNECGGYYCAIIAGVGNINYTFQGGIIAGVHNYVDAAGRGGVALGGWGAIVDHYGEVGSANTLMDTSGGGGSVNKVKSQASSLRLTGWSTDDTPILIAPHEGSTVHVIDIRNTNSVWKFAVDVIARSSAGLVKTWEITGAVKRGTFGTDPEFVGTPVVTPGPADSGVEAWGLAIGLNLAENEIEIEGTGADGVDIRWAGDFRWLKMLTF